MNFGVLIGGLDTRGKGIQEAHDFGNWKRANDAKDGFLSYLKGVELNDVVIYNLIKRVYERKSKYRRFILKCLCAIRIDDVVRCFKGIAEDNDKAISEQ